MATVVMKFGGTSVGDTDKIVNIAKRIKEKKNHGDNIVVVVSAMGKTTNNLIELSKEITDKPDKRDLDMLMATGEQISISLMSMALKQLGLDSISLTGIQAGIVTTNDHTRAKINNINPENIVNHLDEDKVVVIAGFQGGSDDGSITTLGRGGSDTSAVALAASLGGSCEIYTDVNGIYGVDPRIVPSAKKLDYISYDEMMELASRGARVMETRAVELGQKYNVEILVANSHNTEAGTIIKEMEDNMETRVITGVTTLKDCLMVSVRNLPFEASHVADLFNQLSVRKISIDMISQTAPHNNLVDVSFTTTKEYTEDIIDLLENLKQELGNIEFYLNPNLAKLSVVGIGMISQHGVASDIFELLSTNGIVYYQVTTSEISISYTIKEQDVAKATKILAEHFEL
ncbi:MAG: aspartate kinase [Firmicutes bacterium]|nr:aspartate kinase [Bacillota bacterium]